MLCQNSMDGKAVRLGWPTLPASCGPRGCGRSIPVVRWDNGGPQYYDSDPGRCAVGIAPLARSGRMRSRLFGLTLVQALLIWTVAMLTMLRQDCLASAVDITGRLWYKVFDGISNVIYEADFGYRIELHNNTWRITVQPVTTNESGVIIYHQVGTDGKSIYSLTCLNTNTIRPADGMPGLKALGTHRTPPSSTEAPKNGAVAEVYDGAVPRGDHTFAAPVWLAYASYNYIHSCTNGRLRKMWIDGQKYNTNDVRADIEVWPDRPGALHTVTYFNEGYRITESEHGTVQITPLPAPYDKGYKEVVYSADDITNVGGLPFPRRFSVLKLTPVSHPTTASDLRLLAIIEGVSDSVAEISNDEDIRVPVTRSTAVFDSRSEGLSGDARGVSYLLGASSWMSGPDLMNIRSTAISNANAPRNHPPERRGGAGTQSRHVATFILFAVSTGLAAVLILYRQGSRKAGRSP